MSMPFRFTCSDDGKHVYDNDFGYDARLTLSGDWSEAERREYAEAVAKALKAMPPPTRKDDQP
jgi:hypothetical protein